MKNLLNTVIAVVVLLTGATYLTSDSDEMPTPSDVKAFTVNSAEDICEFVETVAVFASDICEFFEDLATW